jgi:sugar/nucleoside kinase (ribokinase family)
MTIKRFDLVVVGHLTIDLVKYEDKERKGLGGPPAYAMVALALGLKNVGIVSRIGKNFPRKSYDTLVASGLSLKGLIWNEETTQFINVYNQQGDRTQFACHVAPRLIAIDIPESYWDTNWMHFSPVIGEVDPSLISEAKKHEVKVSVDVQGFVRAVKEPENTIQSCDWNDFSKYAGMIQILKADTNELCQLSQKTDFRQAAKSIHKLGVPIILITRGYKGSYLSQKDSLHKIPIIPVKQVIDHTGSGDVFAISFLREYEASKRPLWSAYFAAAAASFNLESPGPTNFPSYEQVLYRLRTFLTLPENREHTKLLLNEPGPGDCPL